MRAFGLNLPDAWRTADGRAEAANTIALEVFEKMRGHTLTDEQKAALLASCSITPKGKR